MQPRQVICPSCEATLHVPPVDKDCIVRCSKCRHSFRLRKGACLTDDTITSWLGAGPRLRNMDDDDAVESPAPQPKPSSAVSVHTSDEAAPAIAAPPPAENIAEPIRLVKFGGSGALFEFQASRMREPAFRCAIPRCCLQCGSRSHLLAHVIVFSAQLIDNVSLEAEHAAGEMRLSEDQVRDLTPEQMLDRLPMVPNVPSPGNLPMPYWVCDMCSGAGLIRGQIQVNSETGKGWCRLQVSNLRRSQEFMEAAGGKDSKAFALLAKHLESMKENPWERLPSVVQHRIEQWYKPASAEQFMAYVPDRDHTRTEDGMSGVLISNRRLIYHASMRHMENTIDKPLKLQQQNDAGKLIVQLETPTWNIKHLVLDRDGANLLRRSLTLGGYKAVWQ